MEKEYRSLPKKLWGEPVRRHDGGVITIYVHGENDFMTLVVSSTSTGVFYSKEELMLLGDGIFNRGVLLVGQAYYKADETYLIGSKLKLLYGEIKELNELSKDRT